MQDFIFTLKFALPADETDFDQLVERLGEAGCTDGLPGIGMAGRLAVEFTREAASAADALATALGDVESAIPGIRLVEACPDYVGLSDIADCLGVTRQAMRKTMHAHADFPLPVHEGSASIWHLVDVLDWMNARRKGAVPASLVDTARAAHGLNQSRRPRTGQKSGQKSGERSGEKAGIGRLKISA
nr:DNA-binding protein [uncultured Gellertiella sp.]